MLQEAQSTLGKLQASYKKLQVELRKAREAASGPQQQFFSSASQKDSFRQSRLSPSSSPSLQPASPQNGPPSPGSKDPEGSKQAMTSSHGLRAASCPSSASSSIADGNTGFSSRMANAAEPKAAHSNAKEAEDLPKKLKDLEAAAQERELLIKALQVVLLRASDFSLSAYRH